MGVVKYFVELSVVSWSRVGTALEARFIISEVEVKLIFTRKEKEHFILEEYDIESDAEIQLKLLRK